MAYQPAEPLAEQIFQTTANLGAAGVYNSGVIDLRGWTQVDTRIVSDEDGSITIEWYSDEAGTDTVRTLVIPYSASNGFQLFSAPAFTPFNRYIYTNGATPQGDFFFEQKLLRTALSPQILGATAFIASGMVTQLNRSILVGTDVAGTSYENVSVAPTTNSSGTSQNLLTVSGARPSQLPGRTAVRYALDHLTAPALIDQPNGAGQWAVGETLYLTEIILAVENGSGSGALDIYDGLTAAGTLVLPLNIADPVGGASATTVISLSLSEPLAYSTGLFFDEAAGTLDIAGILLGYTE
jgi:hypothetical protein